MFPQKAIDFIKEHHVLTLATSNSSEIWCSHAFYEFMEDELLFIITSEEKTRHIQIAATAEDNYGAENYGAENYGAEKISGKEYSHVAGAIALETETIGLIRGLQFKAQLIRCDESYLNRYRLKYLKRFPYAILKGGDLWLLKLIEIKYTDNRLGFGKKLHWKC